MSIFKKIPKDNIVISPYTAHKKYTFLLSNYSAVNNHIEQADVFGYDAKHQHSFLKDSTVPRPGQIVNHIIKGNEFLSGSEETTTNNFVKRSVHDSLQHMYYRSTRDLSNTFCVEPTFNEFRELNSEAQVISVPQRLFGDKIMETTEYQTSIIIKSGSLELRDDGVGNIYDLNAGGFSEPLGVYRSMTGSLVFHVGFSEKYPYHQHHVGGHCPAFSDILVDKSRYATDTRGHTMYFNTGSQSKHGTGLMLTGVKGGNIYDPSVYSYFRAKKHPNIDFRKDEDFALSFWINLPTSQSDTTNLFNYVMTTGQGDHIDHQVGHRWRSKFPFDVVSYNQRTNPVDQMSLRFYNNLRPATGSIRIRNKATHSFSTASFQIPNHVLTGWSTLWNSCSAAGSPHPNTASFILGHDINNAVTFSFSGSNYTGGGGLGQLGLPNTANTIFVHTGSTTAATSLNIVRAINSCSQLATYHSKIGAMTASYEIGGALTVFTYDPTGSAGNNFIFQSRSFHPSGPNSPVTTSNFSGGVGTGNNPFKFGPSQSAFFQLKDGTGTSVTFTVTTESGDFGGQDTYPTLSFHGSITSSAITMASAAAARVNQGILFGYTASGNHFPLLVSASAEPITNNANMGAYVHFSSSLRGSVNHEVHQGKTVGDFGAINTNNNTFNIFGLAKLSGGTNTYSLASMFTSSYIIATTLGDTQAGQNAMENSAIPISQTESYERHVFYWYSASNTPPQLGAYTTHSTTAIPLNEVTDYSSGSHDIFSIASKSLQVIDSHPSFSYAPTSGDTAARAVRRYIGLYNGVDNYAQSLDTILGTNAFRLFNDGNPGNAPNASSVVSGSTTGVHQNPGVGQLVVPTTGTTTGSMTALKTFDYSLFSGGVVGFPGQLVGRRNDGINLFRVSSSTAVTESWNHVVYQKSGSYLQLYVNNVKECEIISKDEGQMRNRDDIFFGLATRQTQSGRFLRNDAGDIFINRRGHQQRELITEFMRPLSGALDEIRIFDKNLNTDQIQFLYNCPNGTPYVGNAFYEHGLTTITHPSTSYAGIAKHCTMSFRNTYKIQEHEYTLPIKRGEFNFTMNPSIIEKTATGSRDSKIAKFVTETDWDPYITTVGLYNEAGQLLAIGKLSRALRKEDGYDTTLVVRYDT